MKTRSRAGRFLKRPDTLSTMVLMPPTSFMTWKAADITNRNSASMISSMFDVRTRIGARMPFHNGMPLSSVRTYPL